MKNELAPQFEQWKELAKEDQLSVNVLLSSRDMRPPDDTPTFSWATILDTTFQHAIGEVIRESQRADQEAARRELVFAVAHEAIK